MSRDAGWNWDFHCDIVRLAFGKRAWWAHSAGLADICKVLLWERETNWSDYCAHTLVEVLVVLVCWREEGGGR